MPMTDGIIKLNSKRWCKIYFTHIPGIGLYDRTQRHLKYLTDEEMEDQKFEVTFKVTLIISNSGGGANTSTQG